MTTLARDTPKSWPIMPSRDRLTCSAPAVLLYLGDHLEGVITLEIADDKITNFYVTRNPDKLVALATSRYVSRD